MSSQNTRFAAWGLQPKILADYFCGHCRKKTSDVPVYRCGKGHLFCRLCFGINPMCTICFIPGCCVLEASLRPLLSDDSLTQEVACRFTPDGCTLLYSLDKIYWHEQICCFRQVFCPSTLQGRCTWTGPLMDLLAHERTQNCARVVRVDKPGWPYVSTICELGDPNTSVFERTTPVIWRPMLLASRESIRLFLHLFVVRTGTGNWFFYIRSFASEDSVACLRASIMVRRPTSIPHEPELTGDEGCVLCTEFEPAPLEDDSNCYPHFFTGPVFDFKISHVEILSKQLCLKLSDQQIRKFNVGRTLLEFVIRVETIRRA